MRRPTNFSEVEPLYPKHTMLIMNAANPNSVHTMKKIMMNPPPIFSAVLASAISGSVVLVVSVVSSVFLSAAAGEGELVIFLYWAKDFLLTFV